MFFPSMGVLQGAQRVRHSKATTTFIVNNTTGSVTMFTLTGTVQVLALWGEVITVISANHTAGFVELFDQTASPDITLATGITLSALAVGTMVYKEGLAGAALAIKDNAAATLEEPASAGQTGFSPFVIQKKTAAVTIMRYTYSTTDAPSTGAMEWNVLWIPLSRDGNLA